MQSLYKNGLEHIYDEMYQTFINYDDEFNFYSSLINQYHKKSVLEIGCGTGNLAKRFLKSQIEYVGLDLSADMIKLSKGKNPSGHFVIDDITDFKLEQKRDAAIITGRTTSYLLTNKSIFNALSSIHSNLNDYGLLCFDFIDASRFFLDIKNGKNVRHEASFNNKHYYRDSYMYTNTLDNLMFNWDAVYFEKNNLETIKIAEDQSVVRAFTRNEWELFLKLNNFKLIAFIDRKSYAFDTYVVVAQKQ